MPAKVAVQIGFERKAREGQLIEAYVNEEKIEFSSEFGMYLTPMSARQRMAWYLWVEELSDGDTIKIAIRTGLRGLGKDEDRTSDLLYTVAEGVRTVNLRIQRVGFRGYPILKGSVVEVASVSDADRRLRRVEEILEDI